MVRRSFPSPSVVCGAAEERPPSRCSYEITSLSATAAPKKSIAPMISKYEKTNGVKLFALVAVLAMVFAGAAVMMDDGVDAAPNDGPTYLSGAITSTQNFGNGTEVVVNGELIIPSGMALIISGSGKLTVNAGASIEIAAGGQLIFQQDATNKPTVTINGDIVAKGTISESYLAATTKNIAYYGAIVNNVDQSTDGKTGVFLNGNITLEKGAELTTTTTLKPIGTGQNDNAESGNVVAIPNYATTGAPTTGVIIMGANATLDVSKRSSQISEITSQKLLLNQGATVTMNGHVKAVTIGATSSNTYYTAGSVTLNSSNNNTYQDDKGNAIRETSNLTFTVTSQSVSALIDNSGAMPITVRQYAVNIEGTVDAGDVLTIDNGKSYANGTEDADAFFVMNDEDKMEENIAVPSATVTGTLTITDYANADKSINSGIAINGYLTISGTVTAEYKMTSGNVESFATVESAETGTVYVTGSVTLLYESLGEATDTNGKFIVDGGSIDIINAEVGDSNKAAGTLFALEARLVGTAYETEANNLYTVHIRDFAVAVQEAVAAEAEAVYAFSVSSDAATDAEDAVEKGATVVDTQITIPAEMELVIYNSFVVAEAGELVLEDGAIVTLTAGASWVFVEGKITDYGNAMYEYEGSDSGVTFDYDVKKTTETDTEYYVTYTTLKIALAESNPGDEIQLNGEVVITENLTIPAEVTVITDGTVADNAISIEGVTLTVDGTLEITGDKKVELTTATGGTTEGTIVVNNVIKNATASNGATGTFVDETGAAADIPGAYFFGTIGDETTDANYVTSVAVAGANSANTTSINVLGKISMGDVTFTEGDAGLTVTVNGEVTAGTVTLVGDGIKFNLGATAGSFTGTVASDVTAGTSSVAFDKAYGAQIAIVPSDDGTAITTVMTLDGTLVGGVTVSAGSVDVGKDLIISAYKGDDDKIKTVLTVASGATLNVVKNSKITVNAGNDGTNDYNAFVIDGTLVYTDGTIDQTVATGPIVVNGTMNVNKSLILANTLYVTGTLAVAEDAETEVILTISKVYVGDADGAAGTATGAINFSAETALVAVYAAGDVSGAAINMKNDESDANVTAYYVNGDLLMTSYAGDSVTIGNVIETPMKITGYENVILVDSDATDAEKKTNSWYSDEAMTEPVYGDKNVADVGAVYAKAVLKEVGIQVSVGPNMSLYVDNVRYGNGQQDVFLTVGDHEITVQVNAGYTGTTSVTFGGVAVTGNTITVTPEMADAGDKVVLSVMGDISYDTGSTGGDDGMGLTEILLIILVVLIVVMAIMVALRLMRS